MYVGVDCCLHADKLDSRAGWFKKSVSERIITDISLILSLFQSMSKGTEKTIFFFLDANLIKKRLYKIV